MAFSSSLSVLKPDVVYGLVCSVPCHRPVSPGNLAEMVVMEGSTRARHVPTGNTRDQVCLPRTAGRMQKSSRDNLCVHVCMRVCV